jgi:MFS family permease
MTPFPRKERLFTFEFIAPCLLIFLAYCNTTVFYSLEVYLGRLGIAQAWRGFLVGGSSLATIASFLLLSPFMTTRNASRNAFAGAVLLMLCGVSYLYARSTGELLAVRLANGVGVYLLSAAAMTLMVASIPPGRSGQAFGTYSVAILLPYCVVPAAFDALHADQASLPHGYMVMSLFLAPALVLIPLIGRARRRSARPAQPPRTVTPGEMFRNAARPPIGLLLFVSSLYMTAFSAVFFMSKGYFQARGLPNVGYFFAIQMACMIAIRLFASVIFDRVRKMRLIGLCFALTATSCVLAALAGGWPLMCLSAVIMGTGMGLGSPAMNALMFSISDERFKGVNSNLMTMSQQLGNFLGPMLGALAVRDLGYSGFLNLGAAACLLALAICAWFAGKDLDRGDPARVRK